MHHSLHGLRNATNPLLLRRVCVTLRSIIKQNMERNLLGLLQFKLWLDRNKMTNSCVLGAPISQTERTLCDIHCKETPNSLKLRIFLVASVRHCLQRMERLQYIMQSFGRSLSLCSFCTVTSVYLTSSASFSSAFYYFVLVSICIFCCSSF